MMAGGKLRSSGVDHDQANSHTAALALCRDADVHTDQDTAHAADHRNRAGEGGKQQQQQHRPDRCTPPAAPHNLLPLFCSQELGRLDDSATVYKLIGPAMIKQDLLEANTNVAKRLEYIQGEVKRITAKLAELEAKSKEQQQLVSGA